MIRSPSIISLEEKCWFLRRLGGYKKKREVRTGELVRRANSIQTVRRLRLERLSVLADARIRLLAEIRVAAQRRGVLDDTFDGAGRDRGVELGQHLRVDRHPAGWLGGGAEDGVGVGGLDRFGVHAHNRAAVGGARRRLGDAHAREAEGDHENLVLGPHPGRGEPVCVLCMYMCADKRCCIFSESKRENRYE